MYTLKTVKGYSPSLSLRDTQKAIKLLKDTFERKLAKSLNLERVSAPVLVPAGSGINDDLSGVERAVSFDIKQIPTPNAEIVQSLAKWKRMALHNYGFCEGEGLYTDMNAIRRDDEIDNTHSVYVDQWDWEKVISMGERNISLLKTVVKKIVKAVVDTQNVIKKAFPTVKSDLSSEVFFITSQELEDMFPDKNPKEREYEITKEKGTVFIIGIGDKLASGVIHDKRAPDYDDWQLNGDLLFWDNVLDAPLELSSMGIRVDGKAMEYQLAVSNKQERKQYGYHKAILEGRYPLTIGGGIGQSRLCMIILGRLHIGEVQASVWPSEMIEECKKAGIELL